MKLLKKIKIAITFTALAAMMINTTVNAETTYTQIEKSANDNSFYHPINEEDRINALMKCRITRDDVLSNENDLYKDYSMRLCVLQAFSEQNYVFDLQKTSDYLNEGLGARWGYLFNQGFMAMEDLTNPRYKYFVCKCSQYDFEEFRKKCVDDSWERTYDVEYDYYSYSKETTNLKYYITYDGEEEILFCENIFIR